MDNPFTWRGPLHDATMFYGREQELNEISTFLRGNQSVAIVGPAKIGKTSLLLHLMRPEVRAKVGLGSENLFLYLNCQQISTFQASEIIAFFGAAITTALRVAGLEPEPALQVVISTPSWSTLEMALRKLNQRGLRVTFMLDDFEQLTANPQVGVSFYNALRSLAGRLRVVYLTCSRRPLIELTCLDSSKGILSSPFFNIFAQVFLGLLSEGEAKDLVQKLIQIRGVAANRQLVDFIYQLVGGHPLALQVAGWQAWEHSNDLPLIEQGIKRELEAYLRESWDCLSAAERDVLHHTGELSLRAEDDPALRLVLRDLARKGLLVQADGRYTYPSKIWADLVSANA